jgi:hypothetical protein
VIGTTLSALAERLSAPLWGAELDSAVAEAITVREAREAYRRLPRERQKCGPPV